jgi:hypothetical protein
VVLLLGEESLLLSVKVGGSDETVSSRTCHPRRAIRWEELYRLLVPLTLRRVLLLLQRRQRVPPTCSRRAVLPSLQTRHDVFKVEVGIADQTAVRSVVPTLSCSACSAIERVGKPASWLSYSCASAAQSEKHRRVNPTP